MKSMRNFEGNFLIKSKNLFLPCVKKVLVAYSVSFMFTLPAYAEDAKWNEDNAELLHLHSRGSHAEATQLALKILAYAELKFGPNSSTTGTSLTVLANLYAIYKLDEKAIPLYQRAIAIAESIDGPESKKTGFLASNLAYSYIAVRQDSKALPLSVRALAISEKVNGHEHDETGLRLKLLADLHKALGNSEQALPLYVRALAIRETVDGSKHPNTEVLLDILADLYWEKGQYSNALPLYLRSLEISKNSRGIEHPKTASILNALATSYSHLSEYERALPLILEAHKISKKVNGPEHEVTSLYLHNLSGVYEAIGDYGRATALQLEALHIRENRRGLVDPMLANYLNGLVKLYTFLGEHEKALPYSERALKISEKFFGPEDPRTALFLNNLGHVYSNLAQHDKALHLHLKAMIIFEQSNQAEHQNAIAGLHHLAFSYVSTSQYEKALPLLLKALALSLKTARSNSDMTIASLINLASLYRLTEQYDKALQFAHRSYEASLLSSSPLYLFQSAQTMAWAYDAKGNKDEAILFAKQAVNLWQSVRSKNSPSLTQEQNRGLLEGKKGIYSDLADWLISVGRLAEAEQVMAMLKNQELFDFVRRSGPGSTVAELDGGEAQAMRELHGLSKEWVQEALELARLEQKRSGERTTDDGARLAVLVKRRVEWSNALQRWLSSLPSSLAKVEKDGQVQRDQISKTSSVMQTLVAATPGDALGLQYVLTDKRLSIIFHTKSASTFKQVNVPLEEIRKQVARFREVLSEPNRDPQPAAQQLYQTLLGPVEAELSKVSPQTLILNLDDVLRYVPFAALHDGKQYLAERMAVAIHTSAGGASIRPQSGAQWQVGGLGLSDAKGRFTALPSVGNELRAIVKTANNANGLLPGQIALNADFHEDSLRDMLKDQLSVLHIATHFSFLPGSETGSFLLLGDGKELSLATIKNMNFTGVQLLTLSACETAKGGGRTDQGEEVEGLAAVVQQKGAQSVMASLWPVADASTALLMREFYQQRTALNSQGNAQSLRAAQLAMLLGQVKLSTKDDANQPRAAERVVSGTRGEREPAFVKDNARPFAHPYYWAPFIMMGNWL